MSEDEKLRGEVERARMAAELSEHPLFREALDGYKDRLTREWAASPARDTEGRERIWLMLRTAEAVEAHLRELMETGKLASIQIEQKRSLKERAAAMMKGVW